MIRPGPGLWRAKPMISTAIDVEFLADMKKAPVSRGLQFHSEHCN